MAHQQGTDAHLLPGGSELLVKIPVDVLLFFISFQIQRVFVYKK